MAGNPLDALRPPATAGMRMKSAQLGDVVDMARSADIRPRPKARRPRPQAAPWWTDEKQAQDVTAGLLSKGIVGAEAPGPGIVPYGSLPEAFRKEVDPAVKAPIVGFDPTKLEPRERELLLRLMQVSEREAKARREAEIMAQAGRMP